MRGDQPDYQTVRTGIVGLGNIGQYHAERLEELGVSLVGGMDVVPAARDRFAETYDVAVYDDHEELYEEVDAVVITTPNRFHEEYAVAAFARDRHVLLEKPLAHSLESAQRIADAAASSEGHCLVGFNNRYLNAVSVLRDRIDRGEFGRLTHIEANYVRRRGIPGRGSWFTRREIAGGGALIDLGVHAIDLSMYLLGYPTVTSVSGVARSEFGTSEEYTYLEMWGEDTETVEFDVDDSASAFIRCGDEVEAQTISLETAWATNRPPTTEFVVRGTEAAARFDLLEGDLTIYSVGSEGTAHFADTTIEMRENDPHADEQRAFFDAICGERAAESNVTEALTVQRIIDGIYRSSEQGESVSVADSRLLNSP